MTFPLPDLPLRRYRVGRDSLAAITVADLRAMAMVRLPAIAAEYLEGGAEEELSLNANLAGYRRYGFSARIGQKPKRQEGKGPMSGAAFPYVIAPTGLNALFWPKADICLAQAAAEANIPYTQSTVSNETVADVAQHMAHQPSAHWFQLYIFTDMAIASALLERAWDAGCRTLVITVDANIYGNREWNSRLYIAENRPTLAARFDALCHPRWMLGVYRAGMPGFPNLDDWIDPADRTLLLAARWIRDNMAMHISWDTIATICALWQGKVLVKGIGHVDDGLRALDAGAYGVVLGNHGGRQLDGALPGLALLPEMRGRAGKDAFLMVEGGIRRGSDIVKARLLGADAVMGGRATLYGVAAAGKAGAAHAISILKTEYERTLSLLGSGSLVDLWSQAPFVNKGWLDI